MPGQCNISGIMELRRWGEGMVNGLQLGLEQRIIGVAGPPTQELYVRLILGSL